MKITIETTNKDLFESINYLINAIQSMCNNYEEFPKIEVDWKE